MNPIMSQLHQDHLNLSRLLELLKEKLGRLKTGERPDYTLIQDVVSYIIDYADRHHHPLEDQIYDYAMAHYPGGKPALEAVEQEHQQIREQTHDFQQLLDSILMDSVVTMESFTERLESFIRQQYEHLNQEEGVVFPLLEETLQDKDWQQLEQMLSLRDDPLFGDQIAEEYRHLYRSLIQQNAVA